MIIEVSVHTSFEVNTVLDLNKLRKFNEAIGMTDNINFSKEGRSLDKDRRTIKKYYNGYTKPTTRNKPSQFDKYYDTIIDLLKNPDKTFTYQRVLWQYLKDNHGMEGPQNSFNHYINTKPEIKSYFSKTKGSKSTPMRYETLPGVQAQLDWKESIEFITSEGECLSINVLVLLLGYSRWRIYHVSISKTREVLCHLLTKSFETLGGVPHEMVIDNMTTAMDEAKTKYSQGKVNNEFQAFADDFGFKVRPCVARRANTKGKVEAPMKILEEIKAYSKDLTYEQLVKKVEEINNRENSSFHEGYGKVPNLYLEKEKDSLLPLPSEKIRNHYSIKKQNAKVNHSAMINFKNNQYSVPFELIGKSVALMVHDNQIHIYYNNKLVTIHDISNNKLNYHQEHYIEVVKKTMYCDDQTIAKIENIAKENLKRLGEIYNEHDRIPTADE